MKRFRVMAAALCAVVLLCGMSVTAYAGGGDEYMEDAGYYEPEPVTEPEPTIEPGEGFTEEGNLLTRDLLYDEHTNKQFITLQSKAGNTFYLVIDYDKPIDEEAEMYETYFLNLVDERDLLALMSDEEKEEVPAPTPQIVYVTPEPTPVYVTPAPTTVPEPVQEEGRPEQMTAILVLVAILATGGILAFVLLRNKGKGGKTVPDTDFILDDDDDEDETDGRRRSAGLTEPRTEHNISPAEAIFAGPFEWRRRKWN